MATRSAPGVSSFSVKSDQESRRDLPVPNVRALTDNDYQLQRAVIKQLIAALEMCLESKGLKWDAEHDAEIAVAQARQLA